MLIIDPDKTLTPFIAESLLSIGNVHIDSVASGDEAYEKMKNQKYTFLISDYVFGNDNVVSFSTLLRNSDISIPYIVVTSMEGENYVIDALNAGVSKYIKRNTANVQKELWEHVTAYHVNYEINEILRESEDQYRVVAELTSDIILIRSNNEIVYINPAGRTTLNLADVKDVPKFLIIGDRIEGSEAHSGGTSLLGRKKVWYVHVTVTTADGTREAEAAVLPITYGHAYADFIIIKQFISHEPDESQLDTAALILSITDKNEQIRRAAAAQMAKLGKLAVDPLLKAMKTVNIDDMFVRMSVQQTIADTLGKLGPEAIPSLTNALQHNPDWHIRSAAVDALGGIGDPIIVDLLSHTLLNDDDWNVRSSAAEALGKIGDAGAVSSLEEALEDSNDMVRMYVKEALSLLK
ncbi:MAG: HEAT repeat domain-containing protein [Euryarchaeota archaeon]|nr:HEAT repeat domain-containing protein [Euryarchaeota archaeon]